MNNYFKYILFLLCINNILYSQCPVQTDVCTSTVTSGNISGLTATSVICITSGTVTLDGNFPAGAKIYVSPGATLNLQNTNLFEGTLTNCGTFNQGNSSLSGGAFVINNYGTLNLATNGINMSNGDKITNYGIMNLPGNLVMDFGSIIDNYNTINQDNSGASINIKSGSTLTNYAGAEVFTKGNFTVESGGRSVNYGLIVSEKDININSGSSVFNACTMRSYTKIIVDTNFTNDGLLISDDPAITNPGPGQEKIEINSSATFTNNGFVIGSEFLNNGIVNGVNGRFYFSNITLSRQAQNFTGTNLVFYDASSTGNILDQGETGAGVTRQVLIKPAENQLATNCFNTPPTATNNSSLGNVSGPVTQQIVTEDDGSGVDSDAEGTLNLASIDLNPNSSTQETSLVVAGEGTWSVDNLGNVTFTPLSSFKGDPTPIKYTIKDNDGAVSNIATIIVDYVPVASNDRDLFAGNPVTVNVLANDINGDNALPTTVSLIAPATAKNVVTDANGDVTSMTIPGEGTWSVNPTSGAVTFTPIAGFVTSPTPITYTVEDNDGNTSVPATITLIAPPIANDDSSLGNAQQAIATTNLLNDDKIGQGTAPLPAAVTVDLNPAVAGVQTTLEVANEGTWTYDPLTGIVSFKPLVSFKGDPTTIPYTLTEIATGLTDQANITVDYVPVATNDNEIFAGVPVTVNILGNDINGDSVLPTTVSLIAPATAINVVTDANGDVISMTIPGEGTWSVDPTTGAVTFSPVTGFVTSPTPVTYTVEDNDGNTSAPATITLKSNSNLPVTLINFSATKKANNVLIKWKASNESNFSHFEIQKSLNSKEFATIGAVLASKSSFYNFTDVAAENGLFYYRLKLVDIDGEVKYSSTISIKTIKDEAFVSVENPARNGEFIVSTNMNNPTFVLVNSLGQKIDTKIVSITKNNYLVKTKAITGLYYFNIVSNGKLISKKVLIP